jgi:hypothetical protein
MTGKLIYCNECRAHVQLDQQIDVTDPNVYKQMPDITNISPNSEIILIGDAGPIVQRIRKRRKKFRSAVPQKNQPNHRGFKRKL